MVAEDARVKEGLGWVAKLRGSGWGRSREGEKAEDHDLLAVRLVVRDVDDVEVEV